MADKPLWRKAFDGVERPVGSRLEQAVQTDVFVELAGLLVHVRGGLSRRVERTSRRALHRLNLPTASDVARLREQISSVERSVRQLDEAVRRNAAAGRPTDSTRRGGGDGAHDGPGRPGGTGAARRRTQPAPGKERGQVRRGDRPA